MEAGRYRYDVKGSPHFVYSHTLDDAPNPQHFMRHCHEGYELIYVVQGEGSYVVEGEKYNLHDHSLLIFPPHAFHYVEVKNDKPYERYVINFKESVVPHRVQETLMRMYSDNNCFGRFYDGDSIPDSVVCSLRDMQEVIEIGEEEKLCYMVSLLSSIVLRLSVNETATQSVEKKALGARAIRYLNFHLTENISLEELARYFFVSKFHLCRAFKEYNGVSVLQYITEKRVMYAKRLVELGETAVSAAAKAGFGDYSSFYRAHRRICGVAPRSDKNVSVSYHYGMKGEGVGHD